jgi:hypothetical protein
MHLFLASGPVTSDTGLKPWMFSNMEDGEKDLDQSLHVVLIDGYL